MDYKKIIKSREVRIQIMRLLSFVPDKQMLRVQYRIKTGRKLNLKNPQRYTEKLQWYKLYYRDPLMAQCVDKYEVRNYVKQAGQGDILNEIYGVFDSPAQIDWAALPTQFVAKDTLGGGGNGVLICTDKTTFDKKLFFQRAAEWVKPAKGKNPGREWVYDNRPHRILIERYIPSNAQLGGLIDYKFFCFQGKAKYLYVIADREVGKGAELGIFMPKFEQLPYERADERPLKRAIAKPENFLKMMHCAEKLAAPFPHARIDLYDQNEKIIFGEITFFDGSGYMTFRPDEFDFIMGKNFVLPEKRK